MRTLPVAALLVLTLTLAGCNTFAGLGRDISAVGDAITGMGQGNKK
jgi:predicted small secreted protein